MKPFFIGNIEIKTPIIQGGMGVGISLSGLASAVANEGGIELDDKSKTVTVDGEAANLTRTEYDILKLLMEHPGEVYSPNQIYAKVWKDEPYGTENTVAVHIRHLREKVEINPAEPRYLKVIWGRGYKIDAE